MRPITLAAGQQTQPLSPSPARTLPGEATDFARGVFRAWVMGTSSDAQLRLALRGLCDVARRHRLPPEEALVAFKSMCRSVPEVRDIRRRDANDDPIARAVTMWIGEYYAAPDERRPVGEGDAVSA